MLSVALGLSWKRELPARCEGVTGKRGDCEPGVYMPVWGCLERRRNSPSSRPGTVRTQPHTCRFSEDQCCAPMKSLIAKVIAKSSFFMQSESWCSQPCRIHYSLFPTNARAVTENFGMVTA